ncbi:hypothetical protein XELAEV_18045245mg [Xenopus laevis]|uniref:Uncharacterized protein n=1 Tax=Xenopus laevis TaxID=8355 RepID=A0A974H437_XENLA|nr:hypothetical protein XELAEV_18045245mg [Xenopus laevis]
MLYNSMFCFRRNILFMVRLSSSKTAQTAIISTPNLAQECQYYPDIRLAVSKGLCIPGLIIFPLPFILSVSSSTSHAPVMVAHFSLSGQFSLKPPTQGYITTPRNPHS